MLTIVVSNQKGGVGKTTTCVNLAAELGKRGRSVLAVDTDPQANCTSGLGVNASTLRGSLYDVLLGEQPIDDVIIPTAWKGVSLLPSSLDLAGAEIELVSVISRETRLKRRLEGLAGFDVAIVDCPPSLGILTLNALTASDRLLVPIQCEYYALEGLGQLVRTVDLVRETLNPGLSLSGLVLTLCDSRTRLSCEVADEVRSRFGEAVFKTAIPRNVRLSEAPSYGSPIAYYDASSTGAQAYGALAGEVIERWL
jgi:chromosome partitioning protein